MHHNKFFAIRAMIPFFIAAVLPWVSGCRSGTVAGGGGCTASDCQQNTHVFEYLKPDSSGYVFVSKDDFSATGAIQTISSLLGLLPTAQIDPISTITYGSASTISQLHGYGAPSGVDVTVNSSLPVQQGVLQAIGTQVVFAKVLTSAQQNEWTSTLGGTAASFGQAYDSWLENSNKDMTDAVAQAQAGNPAPLQQALFVASLFYGNSPLYGKQAGIPLVYMVNSNGTVGVATVLDVVTYNSSVLSFKAINASGINFPGETFNLNSSGQITGLLPNGGTIAIPATFTTNVPKGSATTTTAKSVSTTTDQIAPDASPTIVLPARGVVDFIGSQAPDHYQPVFPEGVSLQSGEKFLKQQQQLRGSIQNVQTLPALQVLGVQGTHSVVTDK